MLEIVLTSSESDQYSSAQKEISKFPLMYMTGYFCRSVYYFIKKTTLRLDQRQFGLKNELTINCGKLFDQNKIRFFDKHSNISK